MSAIGENGTLTPCVTKGRFEEYRRPRRRTRRASRGLRVSADGRVADAVLASTRALGAYATGRRGRVAGVYEKTIGGLPYIVAYAIDDQVSPGQVRILRLIHVPLDRKGGEWPHQPGVPAPRLPAQNPPLIRSR